MIFADRHLYCVGSLCLVLLLAPVSLLAQAGTVSPEGGTAASGSVFRIPVSLALKNGASVDSVAFGLQIVPEGNAPPVTGKLSFVADATLPAPSVVDASAGSNLIAVAWLQNLSPPLSGDRVLGRVSVTIPAQAKDGQTYTLRITGASASLEMKPLKLAAGPEGTLEVRGRGRERQ